MNHSESEAAGAANLEKRWVILKKKMFFWVIEVLIIYYVWHRAKYLHTYAHMHTYTHTHHTHIHTSLLTKNNNKSNIYRVASILDPRKPELSPWLWHLLVLWPQENNITPCMTSCQKNKQKKRIIVDLSHGHLGSLLTASERQYLETSSIRNIK